MVDEDAFSKGFRDKKADLPFRDEYEVWDTSTQVDYEHGRLFYAANRDRYNLDKLTSKELGSLLLSLGY
jgi:hypothetical protein